MKTHGTPLHGSYFDLASAKHPDLKSPASAKPRRPRPRRHRLGPLPIVLFGALVGVAWMAIALRPEDNLPLVAETPAVTPRDALQPRAAVAPRVVEDRRATAAVGDDVPAAAPEDPRQRAPAAAPEAEISRTPTVTPAAGTPAAGTAPAAPPRRQNGAGAPGPEAGGRDSEPLHAPRAAKSTPPETRQAAFETPKPSGATAAVTQPAPYRPARRISTSPPDYPDAARRAGEEGTVVVEAEIDAEGAVTGTTVVRGRSPALDAAAAAALERWRFEPARRGGVPVGSTYRIGVKFTLEEAPAPPAETREEPAPTVPLEVGGDVRPPRRLEAPLPAYPDAAWAEGVAGDVLVRAVIDENGDVTDVEVLRGLPLGMTEAAVEAIRRWKFAPATRHGRPVAVYRNLSVRFEG